MRIVEQQRTKHYVLSHSYAEKEKRIEKKKTIDSMQVFRGQRNTAVLMSATKVCC